MGLSCFACFDGGSKQQRREEERLSSAEARAKAAEAAQKRQEQFEKSAAGRAARAQLQGMAKQSANSNKGEPVLKLQFFLGVFNRAVLSLDSTTWSTSRVSHPLTAHFLPDMSFADDIRCTVVWNGPNRS
uniref:Small VCP/p97-interacting protein n=1 Tax=Salix viminalis TaxID=40686 RepID=A0A6N2MKZ1_SALVM